MKVVNSLLFSSVFVFLCTITINDAYKILFLAPVPGKSHWGMMQNIVNGLLDHGHEVTTITSFKLARDPALMTNYTEVLVEPFLDLNKFMPMDQIFHKTSDGIFKKISILWFFGNFITDNQWNTENVQNFIHNDTTKFDVIISEQFIQESWLAFAHKYKAPLITISTFGYADYMDGFMGLRTPWSFVPYAFIEYSDTMTFYERCVNVFVSICDHIGRQYYYLPEQDKQAKKYMKNFDTPSDPLPSVFELEKQISLTLFNNHKVFGNPRPKMPGQIDIAGINLNKPSKPLPDDIKKFLDEAEHGVIYFSWGSVIQSSQAPPEKIQSMVNTFKGLKQRVLWKWEKESIEFPSNVMVKPWMPQKEILEHPNVVLFITHGGLFGGSEGLYNGVPMFCTPFFGDQHRNALRSVGLGYARMLAFTDITEQSFKENINEMLTNKKYSQIALQKSKIFRDNINDPLEEAIYWIEYVVRHNGAEHLKSHAIHLNFFQYHSLDVFSFFALIFILVITVLSLLLKKLCTSNKNKKITVDKKKKK